MSCTVMVPPSSSSSSAVQKRLLRPAPLSAPAVGLGAPETTLVSVYSGGCISPESSTTTSGPAGVGFGDNGCCGSAGGAGTRGKRAGGGSSSSPQQPHSVVVFGIIDISDLPPSVQFIWCAVGVFVFYLFYGFLQESITTQWKQDGKHLGWFMTSVQFLVYVVVSFAQIRWLPSEGDTCGPRGGPRMPPLRSFMWIGLCSVTTIGLSNTACEFLNYPTQVMFKCSKLVPVMLVGVFMLRKRYKPLDYGASFLITVGLILLSVADHNVSPNFNVTGVTIISGALAADAIIGNLQEMLYRDYSPTEGEMILYSKACGVGFLAVMLVVTGQLREGLAYMTTRPSNLLDIVAFSVAGCAGEYFVMLLTKLFGALVAVTTTSCRKAVTLYLSFLLFPKPYSHLYLLAALSIFLGVFMNVYTKNQKKAHELLARTLPFLRAFLIGPKAPDEVV
eukprot:RCo011286